MRGTIVLIGLAASSLAAPTVQFAGRASSCTYTCPGTNAIGGKLVNDVLAVGDVLQCTYVTGLTTGLCVYSTSTGAKLISLSVGSCPTTAISSCASTSSVSSSTSKSTTTSSASSSSSTVVPTSTAKTTTSSSSSVSSTSTSSSSSSISSSSSSSSSNSSSSTVAATSTSSSGSISLPVSVPTSLPISLPTSSSSSSSVTASSSAPTSSASSSSETLSSTTLLSTTSSDSLSLPISVPTSLPISLPTSLPTSITESLTSTSSSTDVMSTTSTASTSTSSSTSLPISLPTSLPVSVPTSLPISLPTSTTETSTSSTSSTDVVSTTSTLSSSSLSLPISLPTSLPVSVPTSLPISVPTSLPTTIPTSTTTSTSTAPSATMSNGWTVAYGCAIDTSSRVLVSPEYYQLMSNNTPEVCTNKCTQRGFTIAAVEYGYECFCASAYTNGIPPQSAPASQCHDPCPGNATETCGGGYRMQIYEAPTAYVNVAALPAGWVETMPCGVDTIDRIFSDTASLTLSDNTPARCIAQCSAMGYPMAGVEYGDECYCGTSYKNGTPPPVAAASQCQFSCPGAPGVTCGGSWGIQVYASL